MECGSFVIVKFHIRKLKDGLFLPMPSVIQSNQMYLNKRIGYILEAVILLVQMDFVKKISREGLMLLNINSAFSIVCKKQRQSLLRWINPNSHDL